MSAFDGLDLNWEEESWDSSDEKTPEPEPVQKTVNIQIKPTQSTKRSINLSLNPSMLVTKQTKQSKPPAKKNNRFVYYTPDDDEPKVQPEPRRSQSGNLGGIKIERQTKVEIKPAIARSNSGDVKSTEKKIVIERGKSEGKSLLLSRSGSDAEDSEVCPLCGIISFPYVPLLNHIISTHKLAPQVLDAVRTGDSRKCKKCGGECTSDHQLLQHCMKEHDIEVLRVLRDCTGQWEEKRSEIESFIEKHAPSLNPRLKRTYSMSSSGSYSEEDDLAGQDDDYMSFITATVNSNGLAAKITAPKVEPVIDAAKVAVRAPPAETEQTQSMHGYIAKLEVYEKFMRAGNMVIMENGHNECLICRKKFESAVRLVDHCYNHHKLSIPSEVKKILWVLDKSIDEDMRDEELMLMSELRLDLVMHPPIRAPVNPRPAALLNVPDILADMLMEWVAPQDKMPSPCVTPKIFTAPQVYMLRLPVPLPVIFEQSERPNTTMLGFIDTPYARNSEIQDLVNLALNNLATSYVLHIDVTNVDLISFTPGELERIAMKRGMKILRTKPVIDRETDTRSFSIIAMPSIWTPDTQANLEKDCDMMYKDAQMCYCRKCKCPVNVTSTDKCKGPKVSGGIQIQMKAGPHDPDTERMFSSIVCTKRRLSEYF